MFRGRALLSVTPGPEWAEHSDPASLVLDCSDIAVKDVSLLCGNAVEVGDGGKLKPVHLVLQYIALDHILMNFIQVATVKAFPFLSMNGV